MKFPQRATSPNNIKIGIVGSKSLAEARNRIVHNIKNYSAKNLAFNSPESIFSQG